VQAGDVCSLAHFSDQGRPQIPSLQQHLLHAWRLIHLHTWWREKE